MDAFLLQSVSNQSGQPGNGGARRSRRNPFSGRPAEIRFNGLKMGWLNVNN
jgi:hypothetical protein